ncbi:MAG: hypothetical protein V3W34_06475 [Phycisphaerae bacterium]
MKGNDIHNYKNAHVTRALPHYLYRLARKARERRREAVDAVAVM